MTVMPFIFQSLSLFFFLSLPEPQIPNKRHSHDNSCLLFHFECCHPFQPTPTGPEPSMNHFPGKRLPFSVSFWMIDWFTLYQHVPSPFHSLTRYVLIQLNEQVHWPGLITPLRMKISQKLWFSKPRRKLINSIDGLGETWVVPQLDTLILQKAFRWSHPLLIPARSIQSRPHRRGGIWGGLKNPPSMQETLVQCLNWEDPLEKGWATHSSILGLP